jgi:hypothetical protein
MTQRSSALRRHREQPATNAEVRIYHGTQLGLAHHLAIGCEDSETDREWRSGLTTNEGFAEPDKLAA